VEGRYEGGGGSEEKRKISEQLVEDEGFRILCVKFDYYRPHMR